MNNARPGFYKKNKGKSEISSRDELLYQPRWAEEGRAWSKILHTGGYVLILLGIASSSLAFFPESVGWPVTLMMVASMTNVGAFMFFFSKGRPFKIYEKGLIIPSKTRYSRSEASEFYVKFERISSISIHEYNVEGQTRRSIQIFYHMDGQDYHETLGQFNCDDFYLVLSILSRSLPEKTDESVRTILEGGDSTSSSNQRISPGTVWPLIVIITLLFAFGIALTSLVTSDGSWIGLILVYIDSAVFCFFVSIGSSYYIMENTIRTASMDESGLVIPVSRLVGLFYRYPKRIEIDQITSVRKALDRFTLDDIFWRTCGC